MANSYDVGDSIVFVANFTDPDTGDPMDPSSEISVTVRDPAGVETTYVWTVDSNVLNPVVGTYTADVLVDSSGTWYYRWAACGFAQEENDLTVKASVVTPAC